MESIYFKMIEVIKDFKKKLSGDELIKGSIILFLMIGIFNLFNYIFQMSMARLLGPADYSILAVLMSFVYIFSVPSETIQTVVSKYTSRFNINNSFGKMKDLLLRSLKKGVVISLITFLIFLPIAFLLSNFLKIGVWLIILIGIFIFFTFTMPIIRGIIQGRKKFTSLGVNLIVESLIKIILAISLVLLGFKVYGAIGGLLISEVITFVLAFYAIKEVTSSKRKSENYRGVYSTNFPILIMITSITLIYSLDIILARRFFSPILAGQYAFVSLIGKVILFSSSAIGKAMFPISSESFVKRKKTTGILKKSIIIVSLISGIALFFYLFFPEFIIRIISLGSDQYLGAANILFVVGLAFSFISLSNILITYNISINKMGKSSLFLLLFVLLEVILLSIFNSNLLEFSIALLFVSFAMLIYSIINARV